MNVALTTQRKRVPDLVLAGSEQPGKSGKKVPYSCTDFACQIGALFCLDSFVEARRYVSVPCPEFLDPRLKCQRSIRNRLLFEKRKHAGRYTISDGKSVALIDRRYIRYANSHRWNVSIAS